MLVNGNRETQATFRWHFFFWICRKENKWWVGDNMMKDVNGGIKGKKYSGIMNCQKHWDAIPECRHSRCMVESQLDAL